MDLSTASMLEKNKMSSDGVWLLLLDIKYKDEDTLHLVCNNEDIVHQGITYYKYAFSVSGTKDSTTELPSPTVSIANTTGALQSILESYDGISGAKVAIKAINSNVPDEVADEAYYVVSSCVSAKDVVSMTLGSGVSLTRRWPRERVLKDYCQYKYKGCRCGYTGDQEECRRTLTDCRAHNNSGRFGGEPTIPQGGLYVNK